MKNRSIPVIFARIAVLLLSSGTAVAQIRLPAIFGDNMVLQRNMRVPVYGWADIGEKLRIEFMEKAYTATAGPDGKWFIKIGSYKAGGPYEMRINSNSSALTLKNIFIGDVWVASGQSNMEFGIQTERHGADAIPKATDSLIHFFYVPMNLSLQPSREIADVPPGSLNGKWVVCSPGLMANPAWAWHGFSAIGYYFAQQIRRSAGVPIGMIGTYRGGTPAQAWISLDGLAHNPLFAKYVDAHQKLVTPGPASKAPDHPEGGLGTPANCYNGVVAPIVGYGIKGVIWYQGETNGDRLEDAVEYKDLFPTLIHDWRAKWQQGNFPFLYIQLPNYRTPAVSPSEGNWPWVREGQQKTLSVAGTGMAVITDVGEQADVHPANKLDPANRLALIARHLVYREKLVYSGPVYRSMKVDGNKIMISFDEINNGLVSGRPKADDHTIADVKELKGFGIAGEDQHFVWAKAVIDGNRVVVSSDQVPNPVAVRYNWADNPPGNLYNKDGLPARPFRTDKWPPR